MITLKRTDGSIIAECDTDSMVEAVVMNKSNLQEANLCGADLRGANLRRADLWEADLWGANLRGAGLQRANLCGAGLQRANLCGANLRGADLWEADLCEADLRGANLCGADLKRADLRGACNILSVGQIGRERSMIYFINHGDKIMVHAGCFWGNLEKFKNAVEDTHGTNEHGVAYMAAIEFTKAYAKAYKWSEVKDQ